MHKVVAVTPAGRKGYLEILAQYILKDRSIEEWHLWDNCRRDSDRQYIRYLERSFEKIKIVTMGESDGSNSSINKFYKFVKNPEMFYIKLDDDIVWLPDKFGRKIYEEAFHEREQSLWWSPVVINNAICNYWLLVNDRLKTDFSLTAQASCPVSWKSGLFAEKLHQSFVSLLKSDPQADCLKIDRKVSLELSRFSINCIAFFGERASSLGEMFCPLGVDDEEWISAELPVRAGLPGRLIGNIIVSHFSFFTQENYLIKKDLINDYAELAGLDYADRSLKRRKVKFRKELKERLLAAFPEVRNFRGKALKSYVRILRE